MQPLVLVAIRFNATNFKCFIIILSIYYQQLFVACALYGHQHKFDATSMYYLEELLVAL
jgi:hypothetical protein